MLRHVQQRLYQSVVSYLVDPLEGAPSLSWPPQTNTHGTPELQPGDLILVMGRTRFSTLVCRLTRSKWSHVAIYTGVDPDQDGRCIVEADIEKGVRRISFDELGASDICVLRHRDVDAEQRDAMVQWLESLVGKPYALEHVFRLFGLLVAGPRIGSYFIDFGAMKRKAVVAATIAGGIANGVAHELAPGADLPEHADAIAIQGKEAQSGDLSQFICSTLAVRAYAHAGVFLEPPKDVHLRASARGMEDLEGAALYDLFVPGDFAQVDEFETIFDSRVHTETLRKMLEAAPAL